MLAVVVSEAFCAGLHTRLICRRLVVVVVVVAVWIAVAGCCHGSGSGSSDAASGGCGMFCTQQKGGRSWNCQ